MGDRRRGGPGLFRGVPFEEYARQGDRRAQRVQGLLDPNVATARGNRRAAGEALWSFMSGDRWRESMRQEEIERTGFDPLQPGIEPISRFDMFRARTQRAMRDSPIDLMSRVANITMGASPGEALEPVPGAARAAGGVFRMVPGMAERVRFRGAEGLADMPIEAIPAVKTSEGRIITGPTHPTIVRQAYERGDIPMDDDIVPGFIDKQSGEFVGRYDAETGGLLTRAGLSPGAIRRAERIPGHENVPFGEYVPETGAAGRGVPLVRRHANEFMENRRPDLMENHPGEFEYLPKDPELGKRTADLYESLPHAPNDPVVRASYRAFKDETLEQYKFLTEEKGIKFEPWEGEGQPYENSQEMIDDVRENKRLFYFKTEEGFGVGDNAVPDHPMLEKVEINGEEVPYNDLFRAVHDYFGHAAEGVSFGPRGEFNAANVHSAMYSPEARGSMLFETHGQNSWVNFGQQIRRADGSIPQRGDPDYVGLGEREFAEQKANVLPLDMGPPAARTEASGPPRGYGSAFRVGDEVIIPGGQDQYREAGGMQPHVTGLGRLDPEVRERVLNEGESGFHDAEGNYLTREQMARLRGQDPADVYVDARTERLYGQRGADLTANRPRTGEPPTRESLGPDPYPGVSNTELYERAAAMPLDQHEEAQKLRWVAYNRGQGLYDEAAESLGLRPMVRVGGRTFVGEGVHADAINKAVEETGESFEDILQAAEQGVPGYDISLFETGDGRVLSRAEVEEMGVPFGAAEAVPDAMRAGREPTESLTPTLDAMSPEEIAEGLAEVERRSAASPRGKNLDRRQSAEPFEGPERRGEPLGAKVTAADGYQYVVTRNTKPGEGEWRVTNVSSEAQEGTGPVGPHTSYDTFEEALEVAEEAGGKKAEVNIERGPSADRREIDDIEEQLAGRLQGDIEARRALGLDLGGGSGDARAGEEQVRQGLMDRLGQDLTSPTQMRIANPEAPMDDIMAQARTQEGRGGKRARAMLRNPTSRARAMDEITDLLSPERAEIARGLNEGDQKNLIEAYARSIEPESLAHAALAGRRARGWYQTSRESIQETFGQDAPRFTAVLAASSPNVGVPKNAEAALDIWDEWNRLGRPTDEATIRRLAKDHQPGTADFSDNLVRALQASDDRVRAIDGEDLLSGPKVEPFRRNLLGHEELVTQDVHTGRILGARDPGTQSRNLAGEAVHRRAAQILTEWTGQPVTPPEVQEMSWSFIRGLSEGSKRAGGTGGDMMEALRQTLEPDQLSMFGGDARLGSGMTLEEWVGQHDAFGDLLRRPENVERLRRIGLPVPSQREMQGLAGPPSSPQALMDAAHRYERTKGGNAFYSAAPVAGLLGVKPLQERYERERRRQRRR